MWASLLPHAIATKTADITANAQPLVMTIHPEPCALECLSKTLATQPFPSKIKTRVPMNSPSSGEVISICSLLFENAARVMGQHFAQLIVSHALLLRRCTERRR